MGIIKIIFYGIIIWVGSFILGLILMPAYPISSTLYYILEGLAETSLAVIGGIIFFKDIADHYFKTSLVITFSWLFICVLIDLPMIVFNTPKDFFPMDLKIYLTTYLVAYLPIIPSILGMGYILEYKHQETINHEPPLNL